MSKKKAKTEPVQLPLALKQPFGISPATFAQWMDNLVNAPEKPKPLPISVNICEII